MNRSNVNIAAAVIGMIILGVIFWMYSITMDYRNTNELAEESYIALKEDYIRIQVNRTIQLIDNYMTAAPDTYGQQVRSVAKAIQGDEDGVNAWQAGTLALEEMMGRYLVLNPAIRYVAMDGDGIIGGSKDAQGLLSGELPVKEVITIGHDRTLTLFLTQKDLEDLVKAHVIPVVRDIRLEDNGYVWVNEVVDYNGGDDYAIRRIHANLQDTEGQYLSTNNQDARGNLPYQIELDGVNAEGEITFEYYFKKMNSETISRKMSFAKLYEPFDWIVATGVHLDDLEAYLAEERLERTRNYRLQLLLTTVILAMLILFFLWKVRLALEVARYRKKNLELTEELKVHADELEAAMEALTAAQEELVLNAKRSLTTQLVAGVAHEINTPLGLSMTCTSHIDDKLKAFVREFNEGRLSKSAFTQYCNVIGESTELLENNLSRAIDLVESFKKVAVDMTTDECREIELCSYLREQSDRLARSLNRPEYLFQVNCSENMVINSYPGALYQITTNLLMNSVNHGFKDREKGRVDIDVTTLGSEVVIRYRDDGIGIDEEHLADIFEPFFTTGKHRGSSGLGLYIVHSLVETTLGGSIRCESDLGHGCEFEIRFPLDRGA